MKIKHFLKPSLTICHAMILLSCSQMCIDLHLKRLVLSMKHMMSNTTAKEME